MKIEKIKRIKYPFANAPSAEAVVCLPLFSLAILSRVSG